MYMGAAFLSLLASVEGECLDSIQAMLLPYKLSFDRRSNPTTPLLNLSNAQSNSSSHPVIVHFQPSGTSVPTRSLQIETPDDRGVFPDYGTLRSNHLSYNTGSVNAEMPDSHDEDEGGAPTTYPRSENLTEVPNTVSAAHDSNLVSNEKRGSIIAWKSNGNSQFVKPPKSFIQIFSM